MDDFALKQSDFLVAIRNLQNPNPQDLATVTSQCKSQKPCPVATDSTFSAFTAVSVASKEKPAPAPPPKVQAVIDLMLEVLNIEGALRTDQLDLLLRQNGHIDFYIKEARAHLLANGTIANTVPYREKFTRLTAYQQKVVHSWSGKE